MTGSPLKTVCWFALALVPALARPNVDVSAVRAPGDAPLLAQADSTPNPGQGAATTSASPPEQAPPPAPSEIPAAPRSQPQAAGVPPGQWVYTDQYGWVWMPYGDAYTSVPADGYGEPYMYLYYPSYGWTWAIAPWVWGWGPWPYFGAYGPSRFGWYGHGWWRTPGRWHAGPGFRGGFASHGFRPAPFRGGMGYRGGYAGGRFGGGYANGRFGGGYAGGRFGGGSGFAARGAFSGGGRIGGGGGHFGGGGGHFGGGGGHFGGGGGHFGGGGGHSGGGHGGRR